VLDGFVLYFVCVLQVYSGDHQQSFMCRKCIRCELWKLCFYLCI